MHLLKKGYHNISILTNDIKEFQISGLEQLNKTFNSNIQFVNEIKNYNTYIDATGNSNVIKNIFDNINNGSTLILLGTPRDAEYLIDPLDIHRKSLKIFGGHELNGHTMDERRKLFKELLNENKKYSFEKFVNIYMDETNIVNKILESKNNFIEVIRYEV